MYNDVLEPTSSRNIVRDSNGYWYVIYRDQETVGSTRYQVWLARSTDGTTWSTVKLCGDDAGGTQSAGIIRTDNNTYYDAAIAINPSRDEIHIVWYDSAENPVGNRGIFYSKCADLSNWNVSAGWTTASGGTSPRYERYLSTNFAENPAIAVDGNGKPHVVWEGNYYLQQHLSHYLL